MYRRYRRFNPFQLQLRLLQLRQQLLLLFAIGHQDDAAFHHFYANLLPGFETGLAQPLPGKGEARVLVQFWSVIIMISIFKWYM